MTCIGLRFIQSISDATMVPNIMPAHFAPAAARESKQ